MPKHLSLEEVTEVLKQAKQNERHSSNQWPLLEELPAVINAVTKRKEVVTLTTSHSLGVRKEFAIGYYPDAPDSDDRFFLMPNDGTFNPCALVSLQRCKDNFSNYESALELLKEDEVTRSKY